MLRKLNDNECMDKVNWGRAGGSRMCYIAWTVYDNAWQVYKMNEVCIYRGYAAEIFFGMHDDYVNVCLCDVSYVWLGLQHDRKRFRLPKEKKRKKNMDHHN